MSKGCQSKITVVKPTSNEMIQSHCIDQTIEPTGTPRLDPCDLITFHQRNNTHIYRVMKVDRNTNIATLDRPYVQGKYSKRRRSNVAVIIVRIVFIGSFLFYCLLLNHSFPTNPNRIILTALKLVLSLYYKLYKLHLLKCVRLFLIFWIQVLLWETTAKTTVPNMCWNIPAGYKATTMSVWREM